MWMPGCKTHIGNKSVSAWAIDGSSGGYMEHAYEVIESQEKEERRPRERERESDS